MSKEKKIVTESLGFHLEVTLCIGAFDVKGQHITYEDEGGKVAIDAAHFIKIKKGLLPLELDYVAAHEAYHLFYSIRHLIKVGEEEQAEVFGSLVREIHQFYFFSLPTGVLLINEERHRQINQEGWTAEHDDSHVKGEMARAGASYAYITAIQSENPDYKFVENMRPPGIWPWDDKWWKPSEDRIRNLAKAGALIAAELDRLLRQGGAPVSKDSPNPLPDFPQNAEPTFTPDEK